MSPSSSTERLHSPGVKVSVKEKSGLTVFVGHGDGHFVVNLLVQLVGESEVF